MLVMINDKKYIRDPHTLKLTEIDEDIKEIGNMITEREITENNYNYYVIYRELGYKAVQIKGFKYLPEMRKFIFDNEDKIVILEGLIAFK